MSATFPPIVTMGREQAERYRPGPDEVAISIRSRGERRAALAGEFRAVLLLEFNDDQWDGWQERGETMSVAQAADVVAFVEAHRFTARRIVIHCHVGISRSASLAKALAAGYRAYDVTHLNAAGAPFTIPRILNRSVYLRVRDAIAQLALVRG